MFLWFMIPFKMEAQTWYFVGFADKNDMSFSINSPVGYLSQRAIERRMRQNIPIDEFDLPVNRAYIQQVLDLGATLQNSTKWLNGITVRADSINFVTQVSKLSFVQEVIVVKTTGNKSLSDKFNLIGSEAVPFPIDSSVYGNSVHQVSQINGQFLHINHFRGKGKQIAVIDGGFYRANLYPAFDSLWANHQILGNRDFVNPNSDIYSENYHGMSVLSIMGGNIPGQLIGTAPDASYWLIRSEDAATEYPIEEYNWAAAAEFADSVGADIINTSLGYTTFDDLSLNHSYADMDGKTTPSTQAANIAFKKGILVVASAGNEGSKAWKYIVSPSDGKNVLAVGAVDMIGNPAYFSSYGPSSAGDIKPNVSAMGLGTFLCTINGTIEGRNGTSFSSPVIAGMTACLWQANPNASAAKIKEAIEKSASLYQTPDSVLGFGIPDFKIADEILKLSEVDLTSKDGQWKVFPTSFSDKIYLMGSESNSDNISELDFYDLNGRILKKIMVKTQSVIHISGLEDLPSGMILLKMATGKQVLTYKLIKLK
jgi:subtilisin family serine protease